MDIRNGYLDGCWLQRSNILQDVKYGAGLIIVSLVYLVGQTIACLLHPELPFPSVHPWAFCPVLFPVRLCLIDLVEVLGCLLFALALGGLSCLRLPRPHEFCPRTFLPVRCKL